MADKAISELNSAEQITSTDLFVLEQSGTAKKLAGQVLLNWLTAAADGHGGVSSVEKAGTSGLVDTYNMTLADQTVISFTVSNGKGVASMAKRSTSGLVDTWRMTYNDGTYVDIKVTNGAKGDTGDASYVYIKYASVEPTSASHDFGDTPDAWAGFAVTTSETEPEDWTSYTWYKVKGDTGDTGAAASILSTDIVYQAGDSGTTAPSGNWTSTIPTVAQGKFLWTRTTITFNSGSPIIFYGVSHAGMDGSGSVSSVNDVSPDSSGNIDLTLANIPTDGTVPTGTDPSDIEKYIFLANHPVGSWFESDNSVSPAAIYGGSWVQDISGRVLISANGTYTAESTGGEATHTLTVDELPSSIGSISGPMYEGDKYASIYGSGAFTNQNVSANGYALKYTSGSTLERKITLSGGGAAHNNMQPYRATYRWQRIA